MEIQLPLPVQIAIQLLNNAGYEAFVVGGAIRNILLHLPIYDYDLTTSATVDEMRQVFQQYKVIDTGSKHGTLTIFIQHMPLEITTYRIEKEYISHRFPSQVSFSRNLMDDISRRDFTMNAIAYHPHMGIVDYFHGEKDIQNRIIRCINDPHQRFNEDALRILRALRFASTYGFTIEEKTSKAIHDMKHLLHALSSERIFSELSRMIVEPYISQTLLEYKDIFIELFPALSSYDFSYPDMTSFPKDVNLRLAYLFLPIKDACTSCLKSLKLSKKDEKEIKTILHYHAITLTEKSTIKKALKANTYETIQKCIQFQMILHIPTSISLLEEIVKNQECYNLKQLAINGKDLQELQIPTFLFSTLLDACLDYVIENPSYNTKEKLQQFISMQQNIDTPTTHSNDKG